MVQHSFGTQSENETKRIAKFIESFEPKVNFITEQTHFGITITATFISEEEKNNFFKLLSNSLNISEDGSYLK